MTFLYTCEPLVDSMGIDDCSISVTGGDKGFDPWLEFVANGRLGV